MKTKKLVRAMAVAIPTSFCLVTVSGSQTAEPPQSAQPGIGHNGAPNTIPPILDALK